MRLRLLLSLALLALLAPAAAAAQSGAVERAAGALRSNPVYVDPAAEPTISPAQADALRERIAEAGGGIYVAVLPESAGTAEDVLDRLAAAVGRTGTYAVVVGGSFRAASNAAEEDEVPGLASAAFDDHRDEGAAGIAPALADLVDGVADARAGEGESTGDGYASRGGLWILVAGAAAVVGVFAFRRRRKRAAEFREVREAAEEDLVALGDDIRALDLDVELPGVDPRAREDYGTALAAYERASSAFNRAQRADQLEEVSAALEEGRFAMTAAKARLDGKEPPERRPPCFFDPRHGPSVRDVEWAPPGGEPRPVPACAADAVRVEEGSEPESRQVLVGGTRTPYWNAGPAFGPWAGGFFGGATGSLVPALFVGSMLGGGLGFGDSAAAADGDGLDSLGDVGGGDFGGGGGDFGGGDFGGGDF